MAIATNPTESLLRTKTADDAALVARLAEGDGDALEELYERYSRVVYSFSLRMLADTSSAEELTQEVFLRLWRQGGSYQQSRGAFLTWLLSVTHNMAIDEIRRRKRRPVAAATSEDDQTITMLPDTRTDVENAAWLTSLQTIVRDALQEIPPPQRVVIELAYFSGLTQREIAERLGEPLGTIKTRMRLGLLKLRERLGPILEDVVSVQRSKETD
jgi:RNA polymerase sigma-70 factor (ECF subfamily)